MANLTYECPECDERLVGSFGDDVHCKKCNKTFETDWDYIDENNIACWIINEKK